MSADSYNQPLHNSAVTSVGIVADGQVDARKLNSWLSGVLKQHSTGIYRLKGLLNVKGQSKRFVLQGVHSLVDGKPDRDWRPGERRLNQIVFIGRNLDREGLERGFRACLSV